MYEDLMSLSNEQYQEVLDELEEESEVYFYSSFYPHFTLILRTLCHIPSCLETGL